MGANICFGIYASLTLLLSINWYLMTVTAEGGLSPPRNLMFEMDAFSLYWKWDVPENLGICKTHPVFYHYKYGKKHKSTTQESKHLHADVRLEYSDNSVIDLNHHIYFQLRAQCLNKTVKSQWTNMSVILAKGDPETAVSNFSCVWYNKEHMTCTWQPGKRSPPASDFILLYWLKGSDAKSEVAKPTQFDELLGSGTPCSQYIYKDGVPVGCRFNDMQINNAQNLYTMVVTDREKTIRPLISVVNADEKIKLNPPEIINITRTPNHSIFVKWNLTDIFKIKCLQFEVEITNSKSENPEKYMVSGDLSKEIPNTFPDADYTIKVRVGPKEIVCQEIYWSDWSEGKTLIAKDSGDTLYIILLLVIPIIVTIATIVLLVYMKRLQVLVFPPIPDPGRILKNSFGDPNDFQQWIKYGKVPVSSKPPKEEICSVILVESPLNPSTAE